jgi:hypothetical protein
LFSLSVAWQDKKDRVSKADFLFKKLLHFTKVPPNFDIPYIFLITQKDSSIKAGTQQ